MWQQEAVLNYTTCQLTALTSADNVHVTDDELLCGLSLWWMNECMNQKGILRGCGPHDGAMFLWVDPHLFVAGRLEFRLSYSRSIEFNWISYKKKTLTQPLHQSIRARDFWFSPLLTSMWLKSSKHVAVVFPDVTRRNGPNSDCELSHSVGVGTHKKYIYPAFYSFLCLARFCCCLDVLN